jgi:hypothetical protein
LCNARASRPQDDECPGKRPAALPYESHERCSDKGSQGKRIAKEHNPAVATAGRENKLPKILVFRHQDAIVAGREGHHIRIGSSETSF